MRQNTLLEMEASFKPAFPIDILTGLFPSTSVGQLGLFYHLFSRGQDENSPPLFGTCEIEHVIYPMWLHTYQGLHGRFAKRGTIQFTGDSYVRGQSCYTIKDNLVWFISGNQFYPRGMFVDFLEQYVEELIHDRFDIIDGAICSFPNYGIGTSVSTQGDFLVSFSTIPLPTEAGLYGIRIRIVVFESFLMNANAKVQITTLKSIRTQPLEVSNDFYEICRQDSIPTFSIIDHPNGTIEIFTCQVNFESPQRFQI
jgi:hypothetical protein